MNVTILRARRGNVTTGKVKLLKRSKSTEACLERLLAHYPSILDGGAENPDGDGSRRWLLVKRQMGVPAEAGGAQQWALDLLFLDQDKLPTLVEVKQSLNTQLRREVIGQLLEYAANASAYWSADSLQHAFEAQCHKAGHDPNHAIGDKYGAGTQPEQIWHAALEHLHAGRMRLVVAADSTPHRLKQIIAFLDGQWPNVQVSTVKVAGIRHHFFKELHENSGQEQAEIAANLLGWAKERKLRVEWDADKQYGIFFLADESSPQRHTLLRVSASGHIRLWLHGPWAALQEEVMRQRLASTFPDWLGEWGAAQDWHRSKRMRLAKLTDKDTYARFLLVLEELARTIGS